MGMLSVRHQGRIFRLYAGDCDYPLVYRTVRELCGGYRGRTGKAQADSLRAAKKDVEAHKISSVDKKDNFTVVPSASLTKGDLVVVRAGEQIPADGEIVDGAASVDESAITGEPLRLPGRQAETAAQ